MWEAEPAWRDGSVAINTGAINPGATGTAHGYRLANAPQGE